MKRTVCYLKTEVISRQERNQAYLAASSLPYVQCARKRTILVYGKWKSVSHDGFDFVRLVFPIFVGVLKYLTANEFLLAGVNWQLA